MRAIAPPRPPFEKGAPVPADRTDAALDVVGVGNAIVDVLAEVDDGFIEEHALARVAMTLIDNERAV